MTIRRRLGRLAASATLLTLVLFFGPPLVAEERPLDERVEALVPRLLSDEPAIAERAERELLALGDPARLVLERMAREDDRERADLALRLLNSDRWPAPGERPAQRVDESGRRPPPHGAPLPPAPRDLRGELDELRRRLDAFLRDRPPFPELPELPEMPELDRQLEDGRLPHRFRGELDARSSGVIVRDGARTEWKIEADGRVTVTEKDADGGAREYAADSVDAFRSSHPEVAARLDAAVRGWDAPGAPRRRLRTPEWFRQWDLTPGARTGRPLLGIEWAPLAPVLRSHLHLPTGGVVVTHVAPGSRAARLGLRLHDVLLTLDGQAVTSGRDVTSVLERAGDSVLTAEIVREGARRRLTETR